MWRWHGNLKNNNVCVPDREQNSSLLCISSPFLFKTLVLSTILIRSTTWIRWRPGICGLQARVRVRKKLGGGLGTRPRTHLIQCGRSLVSLSLRLAGQTSVDGSRDYHLTGWTLLRRLDEFSQLLHEISHLPYEAGVIGMSDSSFLCMIPQS